MAVKLTPEEIAAKWNRRLKAATEDIRTGVEKVTEAPSAKAVAKKDKFKTRLTEAIDKGRWEAGLKKYTLEQWKKDMAEKAVPRIPGGVDAAQPDFAAFMSRLIPHLNTVVAEIEKMPDVTLEDSIARATKLIRRMAEFKYVG